MADEGTTGQPAAEGALPQNTQTAADSGMKELLDGFRTLQGQVRRLEARVVAQDTNLQTIARSQDPQDGRGRAQNPVEAALAGLDDTDPAVGAVKRAIGAMQSHIQGLEGKLANVEGHTTRQALTQEEQGRQAYIWKELHDFADGRGVDLANLEGQIRALPTTDMWQEGKQLIREAAKGKPIDEASIRADERRKIADEFGLYPEERSGLLTQPQDIDALSRLNDAFNRGDISASDFETRAESVLKKAI